jgi:putative tryptophan/tyrosine transport system substrate-binding protein
MAPATDPIGSGFVQSFRHPGGNITGVANMFSDLSATKIGVLISNNPSHPALLEVARAAAAAIGIAAEGFYRAQSRGYRSRLCADEGSKLRGGVRS